MTTPVHTSRAFTLWALGTTAIRDELGADAGVYPAEAPESATLPYIVHHLISDPAEYVMSGVADIRHPMLQIECWGETLSQATNLAEAVRETFSAFRGQLDELFVQGAFLRDSRPGTEDPRDGSQRKRHFVQLDFELYRGS